MFFIFSKILRLLTTPVVWIVLVFVASLVLKQQKVRKKLRLLGICLLLIFTNPLLVNICMKSWELDPVRYDQLGKHRFAVLLTGISRTDQLPGDRTHFMKGADRAVHTLDLYKRGIVNKILITGGHGSVFGTEKTESEGLAFFLLQAGVPKEDIIKEQKARNTAENALFTKDIIGTEEQVILVTSAFHMRRAKACFEKLGMKVTPFPTDLYSVPFSWTPDEWLVPRSDTLKKWDILIKEWVGSLVYYIKGYI
ncbi:MAG: ElyC/SanA/YdcF family protein [Cyclobacteriaceae bacterium]